MKILIRISALFTFLALFIAPLQAFAQDNSIGKVSASSACLMDADSGKLLYSKNADKRLPMASTTKVMTAIVALESGIPLDTVVKVPREAVGVEGSSVYLAEGERITLEALLYSLLLSSANDASVAIAVAVAGSLEAFVDMMNEKAELLGLCNTHFSNPHGLDAEDHYTTARELAKIMAYSSNNEEFMKICGTYKTVIPKQDDGTRVLINHNRLLKSDERVIAGKTGFTKKSGRCLVTLAECDGLRLISVTLNAPNDWSDHTSLYDFGFSNYKRVRLESISLTLPVVSGNKKSITVSSIEEPSLLIQSELADSIEVKIYAPRFLFAKINKGDEIGKAVYVCNGRIMASCTLYACEDVMQEHYRFSLFEWLNNILKGFIKWKR